MACTAMGSDGVAVRPLVGVKTGEGVMTKKVGELGIVAVGLSGGCVGVAEGAGEALGAGCPEEGDGTDGACVAEPRTSTATAMSPERKLKMSEPRARVTCFWRCR